MRWLDLAEAEKLSSRELRDRIEDERHLPATIDVQAIVTRTAQRLLDGLPEGAIVEVTVRVGEHRYFGTAVNAEPRTEPSAVEMATCPTHGPRPIKVVEAGITYLTCGCIGASAERPS